MEVEKNKGHLISLYSIFMLWAGPSPKRMEVEKKKGHLISLYSIFIIYQSIVVIHLLVSQAIVEHKLLNFILFVTCKKDSQDNSVDDNLKLERIKVIINIGGLCRLKVVMWLKHLGCLKLPFNNLQLIMLLVNPTTFLIKVVSL